MSSAFLSLDSYENIRGKTWQKAFCVDVRRSHILGYR